MITNPKKFINRPTCPSVRLGSSINSRRIGSNKPITLSSIHRHNHRLPLFHNCLTTKTTSNQFTSSSTSFPCSWNRSTNLIHSGRTVISSELRYCRYRNLSYSFKYISSFKALKRHEASLSQNQTEEMTVTPAVKVVDNKLVVKDRTILKGLPTNVLTTSPPSSAPAEGIFLGADLEEPSSHHVVSLGKLRDVRFLACFRFKLWWMAQKMGDSGRDIPLETQFLLLEAKDRSRVVISGGKDDGDENDIMYAVFLPLIDGSFRACLQGNEGDELELCLESGDADVKEKYFTHSLFVGVGTDAFKTITDAITAVKLHLKTFRQRDEKKLPGIVDYFGWCTWDAFYQEVTQEGVEAGLASLSQGGTPPKFVIIDDGWQSVGVDQRRKEDGDQQEGGEGNEENKLLPRLTGIKENQKFQKKDDPSTGIKNIVNIAKEKYGLKYVYVWHAITGYWGGVRPGVEGMEEYGSLMKYPMISKSIVENEPVWKSDWMAVQGLGLVNPTSAYKFFSDLHSYLASNGIDGVKVDVQCILETLGAGLGGRVELTRQYHQALDSSVAKNFPDNGCIACMSHNTDALYCSKQTAIVRASDDFFPRDPVSHTIHIAAVAYNSVFLGEFMQPDWDMFHSLHPAGDYHGSARGISGGPIYVSDAPGKHNFDLLKKLVLPDGSILRARLPGRPTKDCLFNDPTRDGVTLLKIWNMNKYTGVLGVYNCQGAAWNKIERKNTFHQTDTNALNGTIRSLDIHLINEASTDPDTWDGNCVVYCHRRGELFVLPSNAPLPVSLKVLEYDVYTVTPIKALAPGYGFAPLGLISMFNSGGAIDDLKYVIKTSAAEHGNDEAVGKVYMEVKGCGSFGAYSSVRPRRCTVGSKEVEFDHNSASGLLRFNLDQIPDESRKIHVVEVEL